MDQTPQKQKETETTLPLQVLKDYSGGVKPTKQDIDLVETFMVKQKLPSCVVNVLIQDVMLNTDKRLDSPYVEKIASHWSRRKIKTVKEAMEMVKIFHDYRKKVEASPPLSQKVPNGKLLNLYLF
jgi:replication initiation and membrane attachment protein